MKVLGILVDENGEYRTFGKWRNYDKRSVDCCDDWHDDSFRNEVYNTEWFTNLGIPYDESMQITNQLDIFASNGKLLIANGSYSENEEDFIRLVITGPEDLSLEQINFLLEQKVMLKRFDKNNLSQIDLFERNKTYSIKKEFNDLKKFYKYLKQELKRRKDEKKLMKCLSNHNYQNIK